MDNGAGGAADSGATDQGAAPAADAPVNTEGTQPEGKTFTQADVDRIVSDRLARQKDQFKDYGDLKAKAKKFDDIEQANKTEMQKLVERAEQAERDLVSERGRSLRAEVAAAKGVPASSLTGATREELEASADQLITWRDQNTARPKPPTTSGGYQSGASPTSQPLTAKQRAAAALRDLRNR